MKLSINHNTRDDPKNKITMEELIKNRNKEFNNYNMNNDTLNLLSSKLDFEKILKQNKN